jgi:hypothetical protein
MYPLILPSLSGGIAALLHIYIALIVPSCHFAPLGQYVAFRYTLRGQNNSLFHFTFANFRKWIRIVQSCEVTRS